MSSRIIFPKVSPTPGPWFVREFVPTFPLAISSTPDPEQRRFIALVVAECPPDGTGPVYSRGEMESNARLLAASWRMWTLLEHLAEILAPHPTLDTQAQIDGANSAAVAIARKRVDEFLAELDGAA